MDSTLPKMPTQADIAERAYQIYERRNHEHGYDVSDWVLAQQELHEEFKQALKSMNVLESNDQEKRKAHTA
jgi:hypothetical protein